MKRPLLASVVYGAVPVALYLLYRQGWLAMPAGLAPLPATLAVVLVLGGFGCSVGGWRAALGLFGYRVGWREATAGLGLSVMGKYLPGKVWALVGRASYTALRHDWPLARLSFVSLYAQFVSIWLGLVLGLGGAAMLGAARSWLPAMVVLLVLLTVLLFTALGRRWTARLLTRVSGREADLGAVGSHGLVAVLGWNLLAWGAWAAGFVMFANAFPGLSVGPVAGLGFALAGVIGIVTVFAPGGIGTREAALAGFLVLANLDAPQATSVAVGSRVWFLVGELGLLAAGIAADRLVKR